MGGGGNHPSKILRPAVSKMKGVTILFSVIENDALWCLNAFYFNDKDNYLKKWETFEN